MTKKIALKNLLVLGMFFLAFGGWMLHIRIHPPMSEGYNLIPFLSGSVSVLILPAMFLFKPTLIYAYVINGFLVILGTITMTHYSIAHFMGPITLYSVLFNTLLGDIAILWGKFAMGKAIFDLELMNNPNDKMQKGRYFRFPNMGYWLVHLAALSFVYALGSILWK
jgi:hypothetical protein